MEFDIVNTPCPGYKTLKRRCTILAFPRVNIKLTQKQNMVKQEKIFCNIELTKNDIFLFKVDKTCFLYMILEGKRVNALRIQPLFLGRKHRTANQRSF